MIFIQSTETDFSTCQVIDWLDSFNYKVIRLNSENTISDICVEIGSKVKLRLFIDKSEIEILLLLSNKINKTLAH